MKVLQKTNHTLLYTTIILEIYKSFFWNERWYTNFATIVLLGFLFFLVFIDIHLEQGTVLVAIWESTFSSFVSELTSSSCTLAMYYYYQQFATT